jgi:hypothetical protein
MDSAYPFDIFNLFFELKLSTMIHASLFATCYRPQSFYFENKQLRVKYQQDMNINS